MRKFLDFIIGNIGKIILVPVIALLWVPLLFPYSDIRAVVATTVSRALGEGTAIDFQAASLSWAFPIALKLEAVEVDRPGLPSLQAESMVAKPSIASLIGGSPGGTVEAEGIYNGRIKVSVSNGKKTESGSRQDVQANLTEIELGELTKAFRRAGLIGFSVLGTVDSTAMLSVDPAMREQPEADISLQGKSLGVPSFSVPIPNFGALQTPTLQFSRFEFKGKMNEGKIQIEDFLFGQSSDPLSGRIRGEIGMMVERAQTGQVVTKPGALDLRVEFTVSKGMNESLTKSGAALALMVVEKFKKPGADGDRYAFRVQAPVMGAPPTLSALP